MRTPAGSSPTQAGADPSAILGPQPLLDFIQGDRRRLLGSRLEQGHDLGISPRPGDLLVEIIDSDHKEFTTVPQAEDEVFVACLVEQDGDVRRGLGQIDRLQSSYLSRWMQRSLPCFSPMATTLTTSSLTS